MRVVLDTNVLLAGLATNGLCEALLLLAFRDHNVLLSEHILGEVARHYVAKFKATAEQAELVVAGLRSQAEIVDPVNVAADACNDADDLPVLGTVLAGNADCLVTGDQGLLRLDRYKGVPVLSPRAFYDSVRIDIEKGDT